MKQPMRLTIVSLLVSGMALFAGGAVGKRAE